jgi:putative phage-type endonuclease
MSNIESESYQVQGSDAWYEFRKTHIGASDVPVILGISEYKSAHELWLEKTGQVEAFKGNWATERGKNAEKTIASLYEDRTGKSLTTDVMVYKDWPVLSASLDGLTEDNIVAEFKYPSKEKHELAREGYIPCMYEAQIQAQLLVAGCTRADYVSYNGEEIVIVPVEYHLPFQWHILTECQKFWDHVTTKTPLDVRLMPAEDQESELYLEEYFRMKEEIKELTQQTDAIKEILSRKHKDKTQIGQYVMQQIERKGTIDYASIPELSAVNLEMYRKPSTFYFDIKRK